MLDYVSVLVPYRPDGAWRDAAWETIRPKWEAIGAEIIVESPGPGSEPADFNHPKAINTARDYAGTTGGTAEVLVVADADTEWDPAGWLADACGRVRAGEAAWALPAEYWQMSPLQTRYMQRAGLPPDEEARAVWVGHGTAWSGIVVVSSEAFDAVEGYDERISWWGADDGCFAITMGTLFGPPLRPPGRCLHHWHPRPQEAHKEQPRQHALVRMYQEASGHRESVLATRFGVR